MSSDRDLGRGRQSVGKLVEKRSKRVIEVPRKIVAKNCTVGVNRSTVAKLCARNSYHNSRGIIDASKSYHFQPRRRIISNGNCAPSWGYWATGTICVKAESDQFLRVRDRR